LIPVDAEFAAVGARALGQQLARGARSGLGHSQRRRRLTSPSRSDLDLGKLPQHVGDRLVVI